MSRKKPIYNGTNIVHDITSTGMILDGEMAPTTHLGHSVTIIDIIKFDCCTGRTLKVKCSCGAKYSIGEQWVW